MSNKVFSKNGKKSSRITQLSTRSGNTLSTAESNFITKYLRKYFKIYIKKISTVKKNQFLTFRNL